MCSAANLKGLFYDYNYFFSLYQFFVYLNIRKNFIKTNSNDKNINLYPYIVGN